MKPGTITCIKCSETKPADDRNFKRHSVRKTLSNVCRDCMNAEKRKAYHKNRRSVNTQRADYYRKNRDKLLDMSRTAINKRHIEAKEVYEALPDSEKMLCNNPDCENTTSFSDSIHSVEPQRYCSGTCKARAYEYSNKGNAFHSRRTLAMVGKMALAAKDGGMAIENFRDLYNTFNFTGVPSRSFKARSLQLKDIAKGAKINPSSLSGALNSKIRVTILPNISRPILTSIATQSNHGKSVLKNEIIKDEIENAIVIGNKRLKRTVRSIYYFMNPSNDFPTDELIQADKMRKVIKQYIEHNPNVNERILDTKLGLDKRAVQLLMNYEALEYVNADLVRHMCRRLVGESTVSTIYEREYVTTKTD